MKPVYYAISAYRNDHNEQCPALLDELYDHGIDPSTRAPGLPVPRLRSGRALSNVEGPGGLHFQTDGEF